MIMMVGQALDQLEQLNAGLQARIGQPGKMATAMMMITRFILLLEYILLHQSFAIQKIMIAIIW